MRVERTTDGITKLHRGIAEAIRHPSTRPGFWIHFTSGFAMKTFVFLWRMPYLQWCAQGLDQGVASARFTIVPVTGIVLGPVFGFRTGHHPLHDPTSRSSPSGWGSSAGPWY